jgi:hypothetical protein
MLALQAFNWHRKKVFVSHLKPNCKLWAEVLRYVTHIRAVSHLSIRLVCFDALDFIALAHLSRCLGGTTRYAILIQSTA